MPEQKSITMTLPGKQHRVVSKVIKQWRQNGIVDEQTATRLAGSIAVATFDWQRTARYAFIVAVFCLLIALSTAITSYLKDFFMSAPGMSGSIFVALAALIFNYGLMLRQRYPHRFYSNEAVFFLGVLALATSLFFFGVAFDNGSGHYSVLFLIAAICYGLLGVCLPSKLIWVFALLSLGSWMGAETGYRSGYGSYFLGMNYPLRFVFFGMVLAAAGIFSQQNSAVASASGFQQRLLSMSPQTKVIGLLYLFIALWILSIFGNYSELDQWQKIRQYELFHWSVLFAVVAIAAIWYGLRHDDAVLRGFGLTFLLINLYTRYFEYFWDAIPETVFFTVLALTLWAVGRKAETLWHLGQRG